MNTKICKECGRELPLDEFPKHPRMKDGHLNICKDDEAKRQAAYHEQHKEEHNAAAKEWRLIPENREKEKDRLATWRANNPDKVKASRQRADKKYNKTPKSKAKRERRKNKIKTTTTEIISLKKVLETYGMFCHICEKSIDHILQLTYDHVIPLAKGGAHTYDNLKPAHKICNSWKCDRLIEELVGQTPPQSGKVDDWEIRRQEKANQLRSQTMLGNQYAKDHNHTEEWKENNSKLMTGNTHALGHIQTDEHKEKLSHQNKGRILYPEIDTNKIIEFYTTTDMTINAIAKELNIDPVTAKKRLLNAGIELIPRKRRKHTQEEKDNISAGLKKAYEENKRASLTSEKYLRGRWSMNYDKCMNCGTNEIEHKGKGLCLKCYEQNRIR